MSNGESNGDSNGEFDVESSIPISGMFRGVVTMLLDSRKGLGQAKVSKKCKSLITFRKKELLRASNVSDVLSGLGKILDPEYTFQNTNVDLFEQSQVVDHIDAFISHNWSTPRRTKLMTLCLHFNLVAAMICSVIVAFIVAILVQHEVLPTYRFYEITVRKTNEVEKSLYCKLIGELVFLIVLFCKHEVVSCITKVFPRCWPSTKVFMDKTCISQTDKELQRQGIESLGAFLNYSWSMVIVYTDTYLKKLWTVYEVASFLSLQPKGRMIVLPTFLCNTVLWGIFTWGVWHTWYFVSHSSWTVDSHPLSPEAAEVMHWIVRVNILLVTTSVFSLFLRRWACVLHRIHTEVENFSIHNTQCYQEADRDVVYANIQAFIRDLTASEACSRGETARSVNAGGALAVFEEIVRAEVPRIMEMSMGQAGVPYLCCCAMSWIQVLHGFDHIALSLLNRQLYDAPTEVVLEVLRHAVTLPFLMAPVTLAITARTMRMNMHLTGKLEFVYVVASVTFAFTITFCLYRLLAYLEESYMKHSILALLGYCAIQVALLVLNVYLFYPRHTEDRVCLRMGDSQLQCARTVSLAASDLGSDRDRPSCHSATPANSRSSWGSDRDFPKSPASNGFPKSPGSNGFVVDLYSQRSQADISVRAVSTETISCSTLHSGASGRARISGCLADP